MFLECKRILLEKCYAKNKDITHPGKYSQSLLILTDLFRVVNSQ